MGWGGAYDSYYYLDKPVSAGYTFNTDPGSLHIYYNLVPCTGNDCEWTTEVPEEVPPVINTVLTRRILNSKAPRVEMIWIDARDANGDDPTLSAVSSNPDLVSVRMEEGILILEPTKGAGKGASEIEVSVVAGGKKGSKSFVVFVLDEDLSFGKSFAITGKFEDQYALYEHKVILDGSCKIKGDRGYSNQAFYTAIHDSNGNVVFDLRDISIEGNFNRGIYMILATLYNAALRSYYPFTTGKDDSYFLQVSCPYTDENLETIASLFGVSLPRKVIPMSTGWNFVSFPKLPKNPTLSSIFQGKPVRIIWGYDNERRLWKKWKSPSSSDTLESIEPKKGYWVYADEPFQIETKDSIEPQDKTITLYPNWNLIGWLGVDGKSVDQALSSLGDNWLIIWGWEEGIWKARCKDPSINLNLQPLDNLTKGKAYWIKMESSATWEE